MKEKVSAWLNRVLAMTLEDQELLFRYFSETLDAVILAAKSRGDYDQVRSDTFSTPRSRRKVALFRSQISTLSLSWLAGPSPSV